MSSVVWTMGCATAAAVLGLLFVLALLAGEAARREAFLLYKRLVFEKTLRENLPTTRPAWDAAARWAETLSKIDEGRAADLIRRATDASRRKADRLDAVARVMAELTRPPAVKAPTTTSIARKAA